MAASVASGPASKAFANGSVNSSTRSAPSSAAQRTAAGSGSMKTLTRMPSARSPAMVPRSVGIGVSTGQPPWLVTSPARTGTSVH